MTFGQFELFYLGIDHYNFSGEGLFFFLQAWKFHTKQNQIIIFFFFASFGKDKDIFYSKIWYEKKKTEKKLTSLLKGCYPIDELLNVCSRIMYKKLHNLKLMMLIKMAWLK